MRRLSPGRANPAATHSDPQRGRFRMEQESPNKTNRPLTPFATEPREPPPAGDLEARLAQQAVVAELGEMALRGASLDDLFREAVNALARVLHVDYSKVMKYQPKAGNARLVAGVGWQAGLEGTAEVSTGQESQAGYTLLSNEPVVVSDLRSETRFSGPAILHEHGVVSGVSVVIQGNDGPYGVLSVHTRARRQFTQYDVNFLKSLANVLGAQVQRQATEAALRRSECAFRETFTHAGMGIANLDIEGRLQGANPACAGILGVPADELAGGQHTLQDLAHPEDRPGLEAAMARVRAEAVPAASMELRAAHQDGHTIWVRVTLSLRPEDEEHPRQFIALVEDITQRRQAEEAVAEANRRKDEFLDMLGHELRNPLTPIATMGEVLASQKERMDPERLAQIATTIRRQSAHLSRILDDLLDLARIKTGRITLRTEPTDLGEIAQQAAEAVAAAVQEHQQHLTLDLPETPLRVDGDPVRLTQILTNLLDNAVKYTDPGGRIQLSAQNNGEWLRLRVTDTGNGIPPERLDQLFEDFDRGGLGDTGPKGLGLGLAMVRRLTEMHGGHVEASSGGPGQGSTFTVELPAATHEPPAAEATTDPSGTAAGRTILLVEDDPDVAQSLAFLLEGMGQTVQRTASGAEAIETAHHLHPALALIDIGLPDMSGFEVAQQLRATLGATPLVALSGHPLSQFPEEPTDLLDGYLLKPPSPDGLQEALSLMADH